MAAVYRLVIVTLLVGCYSPSYDNCRISCTTSGCPNSYECDSQLHVCRQPGSSCQAGDAGGDIGGGSDGDAAVDAMPASGCAFSTNMTDTNNASIIHDVIVPAIPPGDTVIVTIGANGPTSAQIANVATVDGQMLTKAVFAQQGNIFSAIYFLPKAATKVTEIDVTWTGDVTEVTDVSDWRCATPLAMPTIATTMVASSGTTTSAGSLQIGQPSLVMAAVATGTATQQAVQNASFTQLTKAAGTISGATASLGNAYAFTTISQNLNVPFSTPQQTQVAGCVAAFAATQSM